MSCSHDIKNVNDVTLDLPMASLSCASCLRRISPWAGWAYPRSAGTPDDKKRIKISVGEETCEDRKSEVVAEHENSFVISDAENFGNISLPKDVPAELVAENLKLQPGLKRKRREVTASVSRMIEVVDEDEKRIQRHNLKEAAASSTYKKPAFLFGGDSFSGSTPSVSDTGSQLHDSTGSCGNFVSRAASIASRGRGRRGVMSAASVCNATTVREVLTPTARICSESSSSAGSSASTSSEIVSKVNIFKHDYLQPVTAHEDAKKITVLLPLESNSEAASKSTLLQQRQQLGCDADRGRDAPSLHLVTSSPTAHSLLSAGMTTLTMGNGQSCRPRSPDACTPKQESCHVVDDDGRNQSRQRSRSPEFRRQSETVPRIGCRGRRVFRGRRSDSRRSSVVTTCYAPVSQVGRRRSSRGSTGRPSRSRSPLARIPSVTSYPVGSRGRGGSRGRVSSRTRGCLPGRGGSTRRLGSRARGNLHGTCCGRPQSPDSEASCERASRAGRPKGRRGLRRQSSLSRSPDTTKPSSSASHLRGSTIGGRRTLSRRPLSPDGSRVSVHASSIRGRRGKRGSLSMPQLPESRRPSGLEARIDAQRIETSTPASRRCWSSSRSRYVSRSSTPARVQGCRGRTGSSPLSSTSLMSSSAAIRPDLTSDAKLTAPVVCNDLAPEKTADEAVLPAAAVPSSPASIQLPQNDAEIALRLQSLYNLEHKYKLNGLRIPESEGEYKLRQCSNRKNRRAGFSKGAARAADYVCSCCRQSDGRPMA